MELMGSGLVDDYYFVGSLLLNFKICRSEREYMAMNILIMNNSS